MAEEEGIYRRLAQLDTLRVRHEAEVKRRAESVVERRRRRQQSRAAAAATAAATAAAASRDNVISAVANLLGLTASDGAGPARLRQWGRLGLQEQAAARSLGWSQMEWDRMAMALAENNATPPADKEQQDEEEQEIIRAACQACCPAWACEWKAISPQEQTAVAILGWDHFSWGRDHRRTVARHASPQTDKATGLPLPPPLPASIDGGKLAPVHRHVQNSSVEGDGGGARSPITPSVDLDPSASIALNFVSHSAGLGIADPAALPCGQDLVALYEQHEPQHLTALVVRELSMIHAHWLGSTPSVRACESGDELRERLKFMGRLLQAAVDLLDEVVLMDSTTSQQGGMQQQLRLSPVKDEPVVELLTPQRRVDVIRGYVNAYHQWFAEQIRQCCDAALNRGLDNQPTGSMCNRGDDCADGSEPVPADTVEEQQRQKRATLYPLLRWVGQYEAQLAHYVGSGRRGATLSPSPAALTAGIIRQFATESEQRMRAWLDRILLDGQRRAQQQMQVQHKQQLKTTKPISSEAVGTGYDLKKGEATETATDLIAMLWSQLKETERAECGELLLATAQAAVRVATRWTASECRRLTAVQEPSAAAAGDGNGGSPVTLDIVCAVANNMEVCMEHAARMMGYVAGCLRQGGGSSPLGTTATSVLSSSHGASSAAVARRVVVIGGRSARLNALEDTFHDAYMVALLWLRDLILRDVSHLLKEVGTVGAWQGSASRAMEAVLATVADYFSDTEERLLPAAARSLGAEVFKSLLSAYIEALLLGFQHHTAIVKSNATIEARRAAQDTWAATGNGGVGSRLLFSNAGVALQKLPDGWQAGMIEQLQQDLTALKGFFREYVSDGVMQAALGAAESLPALLECPRMEFEGLVREAATRSSFFSKTLLEQVLAARGLLPVQHALPQLQVQSHQGIGSVTGGPAVAAMDGHSAAEELLRTCVALLADAEAARALGSCGAEGEDEQQKQHSYPQKQQQAVEAFDKLWLQLRHTERVAAQTLGWEARTWDRGKRVSACRLAWTALGPRQKEAAETLGFTDRSWAALWAKSNGSTSGGGGIPSAAASVAVGAESLQSRAIGADGTAGTAPGRADGGEGDCERLTSAAEEVLCSALRQLMASEGLDRFESLSLRDLRLQLPAGLARIALQQRRRHDNGKDGSPTTADISGSNAADEALHWLAQGSRAHGGEALRRLRRQVQKEAIDDMQWRRRQEIKEPGDRHADDEYGTLFPAWEAAEASGDPRKLALGEYRCYSEVGVTADLEYDPISPALITVVQGGTTFVAVAAGCTASGQLRLRCETYGGWISLHSSGGERLLEFLSLDDRNNGSRLMCEELLEERLRALCQAWVAQGRNVAELSVQRAIAQVGADLELDIMPYRALVSECLATFEQEG